MNKTLIAGLATLSTLCSAAAFAEQAFPDRTINLSVGFPPGGGSDTIARLMAESMSKTLGQPIVVHNRPGAQTTLAASAVANAEPDGYELLLATDAVMGADKVAFDSIVSYDASHFTPINRVAGTFFVLAGNQDLPIDSADQLPDLAKSKDSELFIGSAGGVFMNLAISEMAESSGINFTEVPYKGGAPATTAVVAGEVPFTLMGPAAIVPLMNDGRLKALGITAGQRSALLPDIPTLAEQGMNDLDVSVWWMLFGPAGMSEEVAEKLHHASSVALKEKKVKDRLASLGYEVAPLDSLKEAKQFAEQHGMMLRDRVQSVVNENPMPAP